MPTSHRSHYKKLITNIVRICDSFSWND